MRGLVLLLENLSQDFFWGQGVPWVVPYDNRRRQCQKETHILMRLTSSVFSGFSLVMCMFICVCILCSRHTVTFVKNIHKNTDDDLTRR